MGEGAKPYDPRPGINGTLVRLEAQNARLRKALIRAGRHINSLRDEWSEIDMTDAPMPDYIAEALKS
jgi:hypothetical protein